MVWVMKMNEKSVGANISAKLKCGRHENADGFGDPSRQKVEEAVQDTVGATIGRPHDAGEIGKPPRRKKNRLENHDYSSCGGYFVTICTAKRRNYFWKNVSGAYFANPRMFEYPQDVELNEYGKIVEQAILNISTIYSAVTVDEYVVMPDHVHILLVIRADELGRPLVAPTLARMVQQFKGHVTKQIGQSIWQKLYYDHVIRNRQDYEEHLKYIYENPMRWIYDKY